MLAAVVVVGMTLAVIVGALARLAVRALDRERMVAAELRRIGELLKSQSRLLQATLDNIGEGISVFDRQGRLIVSNTRFGELLDLPEELRTESALRDILMMQARRGDFGSVDPEAEVAARLERFYRDLPTLAERASNTGRIVQIRRRAMPGGNIVTVYSDITEARMGDRDMMQARRLAERANRAKSDFLANMSHELRTPLNAIIGFSEVIANEILGPLRDRKYLEYIGDIHTSGLHLLSIINDVLDMSKIEAGKVELDAEALLIGKVIAAVIRMVSERASSRGIELIAEMPESDIVVWADERAMKQIFLNLFANAIKFSSEGGRVIVRAGVLDPERILIEVEDSGIGMSEEEQQRAFQPFGQATAMTTRAYGGIGLGLPITKGLVEAQGGSLTIDSIVGRGTTVRIVLPTGLGLSRPMAQSGGDAGAAPRMAC